MNSIIDSLPIIRGSIHKNVDLSKKSWFGVGGVADVVFEPADIDDLVQFCRNIRDIPITILGAMSNVLIRDGGIRGVVIILGDYFNQLYREEDVIEVGAAVHCSKLASYAADSDLGGLEFLSGIPGTVGGAIKMNAGCFGSEIFDMLVEFEAVSMNGKMKWFTKKDINFKYRESNIPNDIIVTRAWLKCNAEPNYSIIKKTNVMMERRKKSQPLNKRSCGSTFKNPDGKKAWELIEAAGCRGMRIGGASISEKHCNFIVNDGNATAEDIENLGEKVRKQVLKTSGINLEWEIFVTGNKN